MRPYYVIGFFLLIILLFRCYGMGAGGVETDLSAMEAGRVAAGRDVDRVIDQLELSKFGFEEGHIAAVKAQVAGMPENQYLQILENGKRRRVRLCEQQNSGGILSFIWNSKPDQTALKNQRHLMKILTLVQDLHQALYKNHTELKEQHGVVQKSLKKRERFAKLHKIAEGGLTLTGMVIGGVATYLVSLYLG